MNMILESQSTKLAYLQPECSLTLRQGLAEYLSAIPGLLQYDKLSPRAQELFRHHDIAHVVFGCKTTIDEEVLIDVWTAFGSDVGMRAYLDYLQVDEAVGVIKDTGLWRTLLASIAAIPNAIRVYRRARHMTKKWPWTDHEDYLDRPLQQIRAEFGIDVFRPEALS